MKEKLSMYCVKVLAILILLPTVAISHKTTPYDHLKRNKSHSKMTILHLDSCRDALDSG